MAMQFLSPGFANPNLPFNDKRYFNDRKAQFIVISRISRSKNHNI
jgi:hypothetical protein